jgi:hypothetical protein
MTVPSEVGGEGFEVFGLEIFNERQFDPRLICEGTRLASVVSSVANLFTHESSIVMSIIRLLSQFSISAEVA